MTLELEYRFTFIDVKEDFEDHVGRSSKPRAQSSPPGLQGRHISPEAASEEASNRSYVASLSQKTADLTNQLGQGETRSPQGQEGGRLPSPGSLGHPEVCRRPCIYFIAGHCENGQGCTFCHMEHAQKTPKLDKKQRHLIQCLSSAQFIELVMHTCRNKAEQAGFLEEAKAILDLMAEESGGAGPLADILADRDLHHLKRMLARMTFSNLIGLVTNQSRNRESTKPSADLLAAHLERLREHFLPASG
ncbi:unnamed protein product [Symbiodinium natans]|uniref:C3H1-type domain-containing protein n=1 Tax=Symbiodinium natans TaxID=878477 RepID=A0A812TDZ9_9DINO|nr:unnamed protein product [Symbiodinium natans]CAE7527420.1 unnamed protein product [Symbiodinium natans]